MNIGVLAVQGAFSEHEAMLKKISSQCDIDVNTVEIRQRKDLDTNLDGLILPGGESTVMGKLLKELNLFEDIKKLIENGLPVLGTCAGLILLAEKISNDDNVYFQTLPVEVRRNAYGRQLGSFYTVGNIEGVGKVPMAFIRAPYIEKAADDVEILSVTDGKITGVRYKNQIGVSYHPEVTESTDFHKYFLNICSSAKEEK